jgi:hypothetical protein
MEHRHFRRFNTARRALGTQSLQRLDHGAGCYCRPGGHADDPRLPECRPAQETVQSVQSEIDTLNQQIQDEAHQLQRKDPATEALENVELRPKKTNIRTLLCCLAWFVE